MNDLEQFKRIDKARSMNVVKSNELIQKSRYQLSMTQQKILLFLISKIKPSDLGDEVYRFSIKELCDVLDLDENGGYYYNAVKQDLKQLADSSAWIRMEDGKDHLFRWINDPIIDPESKEIQVSFKQIVQPYLFLLKSKYTQYEFIEIARMKSKYAIRLYEYLKSYAWGDIFDNQGAVDIIIDIEKLKTLLDAESYENLFNFKKRVLQPAVNEINTCSEKIHIKFEEVKKGRAVKKIWFEISNAKTIQKMIARQKLK